MMMSRLARTQTWSDSVVLDNDVDSTKSSSGLWRNQSSLVGRLSHRLGQGECAEKVNHSGSSGMVWLVKVDTEVSQDDDHSKEGVDVI